ncbi:MAG: tetratricopeptide repeat protein [Candidatus Limimorpha sp.]
MNRLLLFLACILLLSSCGDDNSRNSENNAAKYSQEDAPAEDNSIAQVSGIIASDSLNVEAYIQRARMYLLDQKVGNAIKDINSALSIDGKNVDALLVLADIYYALGDENNIMLTLNKATEIAPMDYRPIIKLSELSFMQGNTNMANAYLDKALEINKINPQAYYMRGIIYLSKNDTVQALKNFMKSRNQDDSFFEPVLQIADIYSAQHNALAKDYYELAINMEPDNFGTYYEYALFLQDNGFPEKAIEIYDYLDTKLPDNYDVNFNKGYVYLVYLYDYDKAIEFFDRALSINPSSADAMLNKGVAYEQKGNFKQAKQQYLQILKANPNYELAIESIKRIGD